MRYSKSRYFGTTAAAVGVCIAGTVALHLVTPPGPSPIKMVVLSLLAIATIALSLLAYRHADEVILHVHKTAWFWGCMTSLGLVLPVVVSAMWGYVHVPQVFPDTPGCIFAEGVMFVLALQAAGFGVFWAWQKLRS